MTIRGGKLHHITHTICINFQDHISVQKHYKTLFHDTSASAAQAIYKH